MGSRLTDNISKGSAVRALGCGERMIVRIVIPMTRIAICEYVEGERAGAMDLFKLTDPVKVGHVH